MLNEEEKSSFTNLKPEMRYDEVFSTVVYLLHEIQ